MKKVKVIGLILITLVALSSCKKQNVSNSTGWKYNDSQWGGFEVSDMTEQETGPGLVFIEGGSFLMGANIDDVQYKWDNERRKVSVSSFYMDEIEVRNVDYREFIYYLGRLYGEEYPEYVKKYYPDTNVWRSPLSSTEHLVDYYFQSPSYNDYPVVGVSWEQAQAFCKWRTDRVNEKIAVSGGYIELNQSDLSRDVAFQTDVYLAGKYAGESKEGLQNLDPKSEGESRQIRKTDGIFLPNYRLPTEAEWEYAALGMSSKEERITDVRIYPWKGKALRSPEKKTYGKFLANFQRADGDYMGVAGNLNDGAMPTAPVKTYYPNDFGLYQMAGNVSEWCFDVYRKSSGKDVSNFNPTRGNVYTEQVITEEDDILINDTTGGIVYKPIDDDLNRINYKQADNINYLDGDYASSLSKNADWLQTEEDGTLMETEEDQNRGETLTNNMYKYGKTSLISNKTRVVKGGSWKDKAYWLAVSNRRYYEQNRSADWIGFRCAMDRLGSPAKKK